MCIPDPRAAMFDFGNAPTTTVYRENPEDVEKRKMRILQNSAIVRLSGMNPLKPAKILKKIF